MRSGVLYDDFTPGWGRDDPDLLVWRASSQLMNPTVTEDRERRLDPSRFAREYEAEFVDDLSAFVPGEWVDAAVVEGRHELPPRDGEQYAAAVDPSGGGADTFTLAIAHREGDETTGRVVLDVAKGRGRVGSTAPDLGGVVEEYAAILERYGVSEVTGDRYAGELGSAGVRGARRPVPGLVAGQGRRLPRAGAAPLAGPDRAPGPPPGPRPPQSGP